MLGQVSDDFSNFAWSHVWSVPEEDFASDVFPVLWSRGLFIIVGVQRFIRESPADHLVDDIDGFSEVGGLESGGGVWLEDFLIIDTIVEIVASNDIGFEFLVHEEHFGVYFLL